MRKFLVLTAALATLAATAAHAFPSGGRSSPPVTTTDTRVVGPNTVVVTTTKQDTTGGKTLDKTKAVSRDGTVFRTITQHCETPTGSHMPVCS